jgi:hypothetical protein
MGWRLRFSFQRQRGGVFGTLVVGSGLLTSLENKEERFLDE